MFNTNIKIQAHLKKRIPYLVAPNIFRRLDKAITIKTLIGSRDINSACKYSTMLFEKG